MAEKEEKNFNEQGFYRARIAFLAHSLMCTWALSISNRIAFLALLASPDRIDNDKVMPSAVTASSGGAHHQGDDLNSECGIRDVWRHNLEDEFVLIRKTVNKYCYVAMDTEFPGKSSSWLLLRESLISLWTSTGVVARPIGEFRSTADYQYQLLRCNVDLLKIIQLGLTFMDEDGNTAPDFSTWQFNFKFSLT